MKQIHSTVLRRCRISEHIEVSVRAQNVRKGQEGRDKVPCYVGGEEVEEAPIHEYVSWDIPSTLARNVLTGEDDQAKSAEPGLSGRHP